MDKTISYDWEHPVDNSLARVIIVHDESTIRSGDTQSYKWLHYLYSPMFNKGRGTSRMISDFIASHPKMTTFMLTEEEWKNAIKAEPDLQVENDFNFIEKNSF